MTSINLCFQVHQPFRLATFQPDGNIANEKVFSHYFNHGLNKWIFERVADRCYLPANSTLLENIDNLKKEKKKFKITFSITGSFLELCQ